MSSGLSGIFYLYIIMADETIAPVKSEETKTENGQSGSREVKYADDGSEGLDAFLADTVGPDYLEKVSERQEEAKEEEEEEEIPEEQEAAPVDKETQKKIDALLTKAEDEGLSEEEIAFMKEQGYEVEEAGDSPAKDEEKPKPKDDEKPSEFKLPEDFTSELDDFFDDDEGYDPEKLTVEDRLRYATKAIKTMRGNQSKLQQVFDSSPEVAGFVADIVKGVDPQKAIKNNMPELLEAESAPDPTKDKEAYDQWVIDQHNAKLERKRVKDLQKKQQDNLHKSIQDARDFVTDKKLTDKKKQEIFFGELDKHLKNVAQGHVSKELMDLVYKGLNYDSDMSSAERAGEVKGMNKKIKLKKRTGDGLARIRTATKEEPKRGVTYKDEATKGFASFIGDDVPKR